MRSCGGRSSWRDWTPQVGMIGYVVHYWQPNHPDVFFRSNVNRTLLLLQIGNHFVPVGESGVKEYNSSGAETKAQTVSAENLNGLIRKGRSSGRSRRISDSIRKLRSEEESVLPVVVLPEEERCELGEKDVGEPPADVASNNTQGTIDPLNTKVEVKTITEEGLPEALAVAPEELPTAESIDEELARVRE